MAVPIATAMKAALYLTMREQGVSGWELARRLGANEQKGQRILRAAEQGQLPALEAALQRLGKRPEPHVVESR